MAYEVFLDSFENWVANSSPNWLYYSGTAGTHFVIGPYGRYGGNGLKVGPANAVMNFGTIPFTQSNKVVFGFSYQRIDSSADMPIFHFRNNTTSLVSINHTRLGNFRVALGGTTYTSNNSLVLGQTVHVQFGVTVGDSGSFEMRVNNSNIGWFNLSSVDTKPSTQSTIDNIYIQCDYSTNGYVISDFWIAYGDELKWFGDCQVKKLSLSGNATPQDFVPDTGNAWERLNQSSGNVTSVTTGAESQFELGDLTDNIASVEALVINMTAKKTTSNSRTIVIEANSNNSISNSSVISLGDSPTEYKYTLINEPSSNSSWTKEAVNNLKIGFKNV